MNLVNLNTKQLLNIINEVKEDNVNLKLNEKKLLKKIENLEEKYNNVTKLINTIKLKKKEITNLKNEYDELNKEINTSWYKDLK